MYPSARINQSPGDARITLYLGGQVRDADERADFTGPGAVAMTGGRVLAAGPATEVRRAVGREARTVPLPDRLLLPGLVNAHAHLQLTSIGFMPYPGDFGRWVVTCMQGWQERLAEHGGDESAALIEAMAEGERRSLSGGVLRVGDIASWNIEAHRLLAGSRLGGVGFIELVGIGGAKRVRAQQRLADVLAVRDRPDGIRLGLEPHAPYSTGPAVYEAATDAGKQRGLPLATHLAELTEEHQFVAEARGPMRDLLDRLARWDDAYLQFYGHGLSPVQWMAPYLRQAPWLCAHCNYVSDDDIALLADTGASVAYCPRASEYFGHRDHRYREMLEAGVNVALGTDSIVCHGTLGILDEMRRLHQRDGADPDRLLAMATLCGMRGLGFDGREAAFSPGRSPGLIAVGYDPSDTTDALAQVLSTTNPPRIDVLCDAGSDDLETDA